MEDKLQIRVPQVRSTGEFTDSSVRFFDSTLTGTALEVSGISATTAIGADFKLNGAVALANLSVGDYAVVSNSTGFSLPYLCEVVAVDTWVHMAGTEGVNPFLEQGFGVYPATISFDKIANLYNQGIKMGGSGALTCNVIQFLTGSPVVDYSSFTYTAELGAFTGKVEFIETSRSNASNTVTAFDNTAPYHTYLDGLNQNRGKDASTATGEFIILASGDLVNYYVIHPTLGNPSYFNSLRKASVGTGSDFKFLPDTDTDLYDRNGNFVLSIHISSAAGETWGTATAATFTVDAQDYTDELNWSDMCNSTRTDTTANSDSTLFYDAGRISIPPPDDNTDPDQEPLSSFDLQGLSFRGAFLETQVYPVASVSSSVAVTRGGFARPDLYSPTTNAIFTQFNGARASGALDPAPQVYRTADFFTIFRGPGYFRMLGQTADLYEENTVSSVTDDGGKADIWASPTNGDYVTIDATLWDGIDIGDKILVTNVTNELGPYPFRVTQVHSAGVRYVTYIGGGPTPIGGVPGFKAANVTIKVEKFMQGAPDPTMSDKDVAYFFGMFSPYEEVTEYSNPMAFLGDVGYRSTGSIVNRTRPWFRSTYGSLDDADSNIWSTGLYSLFSGYYTLKAPFILDHNFVMDSVENTPWNTKAFTPEQDNPIGQWRVKGSSTVYPNTGSTNDNSPFVVTEFSGRGQSIAWDPVTGWSSAQDIFYRNLETPGGEPRTLPIALRQIAPDDHHWTQGTNSQLVDATYMNQNVYENIGEVPGMYWSSSLKWYDNGARVDYPSGTKYTSGGRNLHVVRGYSQTSSAQKSPVLDSGPGNSGNLAFDLDKL